MPLLWLMEGSAVEVRSAYCCAMIEADHAVPNSAASATVPEKYREESPARSIVIGPACTAGRIPPPPKRVVSDVVAAITPFMYRVLPVRELFVPPFESRTQ